MKHGDENVTAPAPCGVDRVRQGPRFGWARKAPGPSSWATLPIGFALRSVGRPSGIDAWETGAMSLLVYAGASQFIAVGMLGADAGMLAIAATTFLVNTRHLLMSAALSPTSTGCGGRCSRRFPSSSPMSRLPSAATSLPSGAKATPCYFAGLGLTAYVSWFAAYRGRRIRRRRGGYPRGLRTGFRIDGHVHRLAGRQLARQTGGAGRALIGWRGCRRRRRRYSGAGAFMAAASSRRGGGGGRAMDGKSVLIIAPWRWSRTCPAWRRSSCCRARSLPPVVMKWLGHCCPRPCWARWWRRRC